MKIVFLNRTLLSGGIEKCIENLIKHLYKKNEIEIIYLKDDKLDPVIVKQLSKYATVKKLDDNIIDCDLCIFCYIYFDYEAVISKINAKRYFCWVHSKPRELENCLLDNMEFVKTISKFICVSEDIKNRLEVNKDSIVIHNFIDNNIKKLSNRFNLLYKKDKNTLNLVVVSRISATKGFDRLLKLVQALENTNTKYELTVIGKGRDKEADIINSFKDYSNVKFLGYKKNPYKYIKRSDYLIMLSDYESWGNVITEAKILQVPCIVTDFSTAKEQIIDGENGIIIPRETKDYNDIVPKMIELKKILKSNIKHYRYINEIEKWNKLINDGGTEEYEKSKCDNTST